MNPLRHYRLAYGWTQAKLGEKAHISHNEISKIETGMRLPFPEEAHALAIILRAPVEVLFSDGTKKRYARKNDYPIGPFYTPKPSPVIAYYTTCPKCGAGTIYRNCYACGKELETSL